MCVYFFFTQNYFFERTFENYSEKPHLCSNSDKVFVMEAHTGRSSHFFPYIK